MAAVLKENADTMLKEKARRLCERAAGSSEGAGRVGHGRAGDGDTVDSGATVAGALGVSVGEGRRGRTRGS